MDYSNLLTEEIAGRYIGGVAHPISVRTMQRYRKEGIGPPYIQVGRVVRYHHADLDAYLAERTCQESAALSPCTNEGGLCHD